MQVSGGKHSEKPFLLIQLRQLENGHIPAGDEELLQGVAEEAKLNGWQFLNVELSRGVIPTDPFPVGAIIRSLPDEPLAQRLREMGCPIVRVGQFPHPQDSEIPAVLTDYSAVGHLAAEHFAERSFQHTAFIGFDPWANMKRLYDAFAERGRDIGQTCHLLRLQQQGAHSYRDALYRFERRARQVADWLSSLPKPVGILGQGDVLAGRICAWCRLAGLAIPEEVAILGVGNTRFDCEAAPVPLSSVDINSEERGRHAVQLLRRLADGHAPAESVVRIPPKGVVERHSTNVVAVSDTRVARALRFIWDYFDQALSVEKIAEHVGVSRSTLDRAFRAHLNRGVNAELQRKRLEHCCELLKSTEMTIKELADASGFGSPNYLHTSFRKHFGITPREYRLRETGEKELLD